RRRPLSSQFHLHLHLHADACCRRGSYRGGVQRSRCLAAGGSDTGSSARGSGFPANGGGGASMHWVLGSSLRFWRLVLALAIGLMVFGFTQLRSAPVDVYHELMLPPVEVPPEALGLSPAAVERLTTVHM